jgi:hypothetical protein
MPRQDTDNGVVAPTLRVTQRDDSGQSITYVLGRTIASAQGAGVEEAPAAPAASDDPANAAAHSSSDQAGPPVGDDAISFVAPSVQAPGAGEGIEVPTSFVLPDLASVAAGSAGTGPGAPEGTVASAAPTVVRLASGNGVVAAPARDTRRMAARLLISASDTTPLFLVLALALVSALGTALFLRRLGSRLG